MKRLAVLVTFLLLLCYVRAGHFLSERDVIAETVNVKDVSASKPYLAIQYVDNSAVLLEWNGAWNVVKWYFNISDIDVYKNILAIANRSGLYLVDLSSGLTTVIDTNNVLFVDLKLPAIYYVKQTETGTYETFAVLSENLTVLCKNEYPYDEGYTPLTLDGCVNSSVCYVYKKDVNNVYSQQISCESKGELVPYKVYIEEVVDADAEAVAGTLYSEVIATRTHISIRTGGTVYDFDLEYPISCADVSDVLVCDAEYCLAAVFVGTENVVKMLTLSFEPSLTTKYSQQLVKLRSIVFYTSLAFVVTAIILWRLGYLTREV